DRSQPASCAHADGHAVFGGVVGRRQGDTETAEDPRCPTELRPGFEQWPELPARPGLPVAHHAGLPSVVEPGSAPPRVRAEEDGQAAQHGLANAAHVVLTGPLLPGAEDGLE